MGDPPSKRGADIANRIFSTPTVRLSAPHHQDQAKGLSDFDKSILSGCRTIAYGPVSMTLCSAWTRTPGSANLLTLSTHMKRHQLMVKSTYPTTTSQRGTRDQWNRPSSS